MNEQTEAVQRMQDYIEAHLDETITLADLSKASLYSPWYSYRLFCKWVNITPADYIRRLRLSRSALRLRDGSDTVAQTAFELGFGSVDGYQRAFFREFGCNPGEYSHNPVPLYLFTPFDVKYRKARRENNMETIKSVFIQIIEKPARKVIIKRGIKAADYFSYCSEVGCDVWGLLLSIKSISSEPYSLWLPQQYIKPGTSEYVQGTEVSLDYSGEIPEGFDLIELPSAKYLMFQGEPFDEEYYCEAIEQLWQAIDRYEPSAIGYEWDKSNPRIQLEPIGHRGYIELVAIKPAAKG